MTAIPFRQPNNSQKLTNPALPGVEVEFVLITPEVAQRWLTDWNTHNRRPRPKDVAGLARNMAANRFPFNGDVIRRSDDGTLLDGQHRLMAIVESGKPQLMLVVSGLPFETQATMDAGIKRQFGDDLLLEGEHNSNLLAAVTRKVALWYAGSFMFESSRKITKPELAETLDAHPELRLSASFAAGHRTNGISPANMAMSHWLFVQISPDEAEWFLSRIHDGVGLPAGHPALLVTKRLQQNLARRIRFSDGEQLALVITAWNAYRDGRTGQTHLKVPGNLSSTNFPMPR